MSRLYRNTAAISTFKIKQMHILDMSITICLNGLRNTYML